MVWSLNVRRAHLAFLPSNLATQDLAQRVGLLAAIALVSIALWQTTLGRFLLYPFTILATWFHEMGHGVAAMLTGSSIERLLIFADGSGLAVSLRPADSFGLADAIIAAGGPLGPALAGALLIVASRSAPATRTALMGLGAALLLSTLIWVRTLIGWIVLPPLGLAILLLANSRSLSWQRFGIQLLGVQACISAWSQFDYLFSSDGRVGGSLDRSDTAAIADALLLPYWFWGAAISASIIALLWWSIRVAFRR